jgi:hypothetical protein
VKKSLPIILGSLALFFVVLLAIWLRPSRPQYPQGGPNRAFASFPLNKPQQILFQLRETSFSQFSPLQMQDQLRDWFLYMVLTDSSLKTDQLRRVLFDVPPARFSYLDPVSNFEYGEVRSRAIGNGEVVALAPKPNSSNRDLLAGIADREYKTAGERPKKIHVFEYSINPNFRGGSITRRATIDGKELFSAKYGYIERQVSSAADLDRFVQDSDSIVSAHIKDGKLLLAGRKLLDRTYGKINTEDIAALWQSEEKVRLGGRSSGFSLDPAFDHSALQRAFPEILRLLQRTSATKNEIELARLGAAEGSEEQLLDLLYRLSHNGSVEDVKIVRQIHDHTLDLQYQHARYDGDLRGTAVGMVLFYTDLTAKLWAFDFADSAPSHEVEDFVPLLNVWASPIYERETRELASTRLWFGPNDSGFQRLNSGILFAPNATRVYAASANSFKPGDESAPNAESAAFLGWWNHHYDQVAKYEPQYQRLNEIMKWSLVVSWLSHNNSSDRLAFLQSTSVRRDYWFPQWAADNKDLKFDRWENIKFSQRTDGSSVESLPLLISKTAVNGRKRQSYIGGVSLGSADVIESRPPVPQGWSDLSKRSTNDYKSSDGDSIRSFENTAFKFSPPEGRKYSVDVKPDPSARMRGIDIDVGNATVGYTFERNTSGLNITVRSGNYEVGEFDIHKTSDGFAGVYSSYDVDIIESLAKGLDEAARTGGNEPYYLSQTPGVRSVLVLPADSESPAAKTRYLVRINGKNEWLKVQPQDATTTASSNTSFQIGSSREGSQSRWNVEAITPDEIQSILENNGYLVLEHSPEKTPQGIHLTVNSRGPPPDHNVTKIQVDDFGGGPATALRDNTTGSIYIDLKKPSPRSNGTLRPSEYRAGFALAGLDAGPSLSLIPDVPEFVQNPSLLLDVVRGPPEQRSQVLRALANLPADAPPDFRQAVGTIVRANAFAEEAASQGKTNLRPMIFVEGGKFRFEVEVLKSISSKINRDQIKGDGVFFIDRSLTKLGNTDWNASILPALSQAIPLNLEFYRLDQSLPGQNMPDALSIRTAAGIAAYDRLYFTSQETVHSSDGSESMGSTKKAKAGPVYVIKLPAATNQASSASGGRSTE